MKLLAIFSLLTISVLALPESKIWNGNVAFPGQAPYMVGKLSYVDGVGNQPVNFCGGSILNELWVITSAHWADDNPTQSREEIVAGQHFVSVASRSGREQFRDLSLVVLHPNYDFRPISAYDVGLVRVDRPFVFNDFVRPIALAPQANRPEVTGRIRSFGWGMINSNIVNPIFSDVLRVSKKQKYSRKFFSEQIQFELRLSNFQLCLSIFAVNSSTHFGLEIHSLLLISVPWFFPT